jgi:hypothetical protein
MDYMIDISFSKDLEGNTIFYRWGYYSSYYILPNVKKKETIRAFIKRFYLITLGLFAIINILLGIQYGLLVFPVAFVWYYFETAHLLKGMKKQSR